MCVFIFNDFLLETIFWLNKLKLVSTVSDKTYRRCTNEKKANCLTEPGRGQGGRDEILRLESAENRRINWESA